MTPQLQQAIKLLQLSTIELQQEIQEALDSNPMLEMEESFDNDNTHDFDKGSDDSDYTRQQEVLADPNSPDTPYRP